MRSPSFVQIVTACLCLALVARYASAASSPLTVTGFNQDIVVESSTTPFSNQVTATMDNGTVKTANTWNAQGANTAAPTSGLPAAATILNSEATPAQTFTLQPYTGNNALLLDNASSTGTLTLTTPTLLSELVIYAASGNGSITNAPLTINFSDGTPDLNLTYNAPDWFGGSPTALTAHGRVDVTAGTFDAVGTDNPRLYQTVLDLSGSSSHPVASIDFGWNGDPAGNTHTAVMAVSGQVVPEPATGVLLLTSSILLLRRRTRSQK